MLLSGRVVFIYRLFVRLWNLTITLPNTSAARNAGRLVATGQIRSAESNDMDTCEESHHDRLTAYTASKKVPNATALDEIKADAPSLCADLTSSTRRWPQKTATATRKMPTLMDAWTGADSSSLEVTAEPTPSPKYTSPKLATRCHHLSRMRAFIAAT